MKCTHPNHVDGELCLNRAVGCSPYCVCCMGELAKSEFHSMNLDKSHIDQVEYDIRPPLGVAITIPVNTGAEPHPVVYVGQTIFSWNRLEDEGKGHEWQRRIEAIAANLTLTNTPVVIQVQWLDEPGVECYYEPDGEVGLKKAKALAERLAELHQVKFTEETEKLFGQILAVFEVGASGDDDDKDCFHIEVVPAKELRIEDWS